MKKMYSFFLAVIVPGFLLAQTKTADTVIVELAKTSRIVFTMEDSSDLDQLREYDYQAMFDDIIDHLEGRDSTKPEPVITYREDPEDPEVDEDDEESEEDEEDEEADEEDEEDEWNWWRNHTWEGQHRRVRNLINFDIGTNNYLTENGFPDEDGSLYTVRPWGSWNVAVNTVLRTRLTKNFHIDLGAGVSWYNFKFLNERVVVSSDSNQVFFYEDQRDLDYVKSKLSIAYVNASLMPTLSFGPERSRKRFWNEQSHTFRLGLGGYIGYRIESHYKQVIEVDGENEAEKDRGNFYLNNLRYGARLHVGIHDADFYINYDLSDLFVEGRGPELHPISFGFIF